LKRSSSSNTPSAIINVSSILATLPSPFNPIYGATKAFNRAFSRALTAEYGQLGIDVLCVTPGLVQSQLTGLTEGSVLASTALSTAEGALSALGVQVECYPHWMHGVTGALGMVLAWLPQKMSTVFCAGLLRFLPKPPGINVSRDLRVRN
jgi:short-subunit dehydrogenase